jgi:predicted DNA-binding antitoxin AbrB/MazE fold protein
MKMIQAVYEQGVFRPHGSVELPERTEVEFEPKVVGEEAPPTGNMEGIYEVMSRRFNSGERDVAARHNEHQP